MNENTDNKIEKKRFFYAMFIPFSIVLFMFLSFLLEKGMNWDFHQGGVFPRRIENLWGILSIIFIHGDWGHLFNNILSFFILATTLYYFYAPIATKILLVSYICSGFLLWIIGRESWHIGASGLIYALVFFLFTSGIIRRHIPLIAISLIMVFLYGNIVWHIFPWQVNDPISWEGHLAGGITGFTLAILYRKQGPQKPEKIWEEDESDPEDINTDTEDIQY